MAIVIGCAFAFCHVRLCSYVWLLAAPKLQRDLSSTQEESGEVWLMKECEKQLRMAAKKKNLDIRNYFSEKPVSHLKSSSLIKCVGDNITGNARLRRRSV